MYLLCGSKDPSDEGILILSHLNDHIVRAMRVLVASDELLFVAIPSNTWKIRDGGFAVRPADNLSPALPLKLANPNLLERYGVVSSKLSLVSTTEAFDDGTVVFHATTLKDDCLVSDKRASLGLEVNKTILTEEGNTLDVTNNDAEQITQKGVSCSNTCISGRICIIPVKTYLGFFWQSHSLRVKLVKNDEQKAIKNGEIHCATKGNSTENEQVCDAIKVILPSLGLFRIKVCGEFHNDKSWKGEDIYGVLSFSASHEGSSNKHKC